MACFLVPTTEAVVLTAVNHHLKKKEAAKAELVHQEVEAETRYVAEAPEKISWSRKLTWLTSLLWGGAFLLLFEHIWHGEVVPWAPFLTAMNSAADTAEMLHEMSTVGVSMAVVVTAVWFAMTLVADSLYRRSHVAVEATGK